MSVNCDLCQASIPSDEQNTYSCYMCGYGSNKNINQNICDDCTMMYECSRCGGQCCLKCTEKKYYCCGNGIVLCGSHCPQYVNDDQEESCAHGHDMKMLSCGHWGCNYHIGGCLTCTRERGNEGGNEANQNQEIIELEESDEEEVDLDEDINDDDDDDDLIEIDESDNEGIDDDDDALIELGECSNEEINEGGDNLIELDDSDNTNHQNQ